MAETIDFAALSLLDALDFCWLVAIETPGPYEGMARRWFTHWGHFG